MDVLYILGSGSKHRNAELRYSLRSLERHLKNYSRIIVVGENPRFLSNEVEYHYIQEAEGNKEYRIAHKIQEACILGIVKGDFLFMNDDLFFTKETDAENYPFLHKGDLYDECPNKRYQISLRNTADFLKNHSKKTKHFDVHTPIIYNRMNFLKLHQCWNESYRHRWGFVVKSVYANFYGIEGERYTDQKLSSLNKDRIKQTNCFSCSDLGWRRGIGDYLKELYPKKSKFEI